MPFPRGTVLVYSGSGIADPLIRIGTGSMWTHCAVALGNGKAIQAQFGGNARLMNEVQDEPTAKFAYPGDVEVLISALQSKLNAPYDYVGGLMVPIWNITNGLNKLLGRKGGWCLDRDLQNTKARNCSSFITEAIDSDKASWGKLSIAPWKPLRVVTPQDVYDAFEAAGLEIHP